MAATRWFTRQFPTQLIRELFRRSRERSRKNRELATDVSVVPVEVFMSYVTLRMASGAMDRFAPAVSFFHQRAHIRHHVQDLILAHTQAKWLHGARRPAENDLE